MLAVLGLIVALVFADRGDLPPAVATLIFALAALAWAIAAWGGVVLAGLLARNRSPMAQLALSQILSVTIAVTTALGLAEIFRQYGTSASDVLLAGSIAAASGWFLAAALGELSRLRALGNAVSSQDDVGMIARAQADAITPTTIQSSEWLSLGLALGYGVAAFVFGLGPILAVVAIPLAAAAAAGWGLRHIRRTRDNLAK